MNGVASLKAAFDAQPLQRREVFERAAAGNLINMARIAHAMLPGQLVEKGLGLMHDHARRMTGLRVREPPLLEQGDLDAGRGEHIRGCAPHRSSADDGHLGLERAAMPRIRRPPG